MLATDGRAFSSPAPGVRRYVTQLYDAMEALLPAGSVAAIGGAEDVMLPRVCRRATEGWSPPTNLGRHLWGLPRAIARHGVSVYHAPAYVAPLTGRVPTVLSIHDVSYERRPEWYPYRRDLLRRAFYRRSAQTAAAVVTPSRFTADELMAAYGVPSRRVHVVPLAAGPSFSVDAGDAGPPGDALPRYLLHVGDLHLRRDLTTAIAVLAELRQSSDAWQLVLIGSDRGVWARLSAQLARAGLSNAVTWFPSVTEANLHDWYRRSFCLLYPSRYEGFGLPLVEAMASGLPIVAADASATPELVGEAALLFPPGDARRAASQVRQLSERPEAWRERRALGRERATHYTWSRTAADTLACIEAIGDPGGAQ